MIDVQTHEEESRSTPARITVIVQQRYTVEAGSTTGSRLKELAGIPAGFTLYRKAKGGNEPLADGAAVDVRNGDHFFARPTS